MDKERLRVRLYKLIEGAPGITKNQMLDDVKEDFEGVNFSHVYLIVKKFIEDGVVKVDGKKKNTGHYMPNADIPEDLPKATVSPKKDGGQVAYERPIKKATKRFVLEKNENNNWRIVDENDIREPIDNLFGQCVRLIPLHYRIRDQHTGDILNEREATFNRVKNTVEATA